LEDLFYLGLSQNLIWISINQYCRKKIGKRKNLIN